MMRWAIIAAVIAIVAGILGFGLVVEAVAGIAKLFFYLFLALFVVLFISAVVVGRKVKSGLSRHSDKHLDGPRG